MGGNWSASTLTRTRVHVFGSDPICQAGVAAYLEGTAGELELVDDEHVDEAEVALIVSEAIDEPALRVVRAFSHSHVQRPLLLVNQADEAGAARAVQAGAVGIVRRASVTKDSLLRAVRAASREEGVMPPDLLGGILRQTRHLRADVMPLAALGAGAVSPREEAVLRLLSNGSDTREIALTLSYSERTVKSIIQDVTRRFGLRNRAHAVAYALREGII